MPAATRDFQITYGTFTVGGAGRRLTDVIRTERRHTEFVLEFAFMVTQDTPANFAAELLLVEESFRIPYQDVTVTGGDTSTNANWYHLTADAATGEQGFDAQPEILSQEEGATGLSRKFRVRITVQLPADNLGSTAGRTGRRDSTVSVAYSPSRRRTITIAGTYTSIGTTLARNQYEAQIAAYVTAVLASIDSTATFELVGEPTTEAEDTVDGSSSSGRGRIIRFQREYQELLFNQAGGSPDSTSIVSQSLQIERLRRAPGDARSVHRRLDEARVVYSCSVDSTQTTDLVSLWENTIRGFIITQVATVLTGARALVEDAPRFDYDENKISATMLFMGLTTGTAPFEATMVIDDRYETGQILVPAWAGHEFAKYDYDGPARRLRTINRTFRQSAPGRDTINPLPRQGFFPNPANGKTLVHEINSAPMSMGILGSERFGFYEITERIEIEYFVPIDPAGVPVDAPIGEELDVVDPPG